MSAFIPHDEGIKCEREMKEVENMFCYLVIDLSKELCTKSGDWMKFVQR